MGTSLTMIRLLSKTKTFRNGMTPLVTMTLAVVESSKLLRLDVS